MEKIFYIVPEIISYNLYISDMTDEQEAYIKKFYKDLKRQPIDECYNTQYEIFDKSDDCCVSDKLADVIKYLYKEGFDNNSSCNYCNY